MNKSTKAAPKLAAPLLKSLRAADAALARSAQSTQVAFQGFVAVIVKAFPGGVKPSDLLKIIHGPDAQSKADDKPTAEYTRVARAVRAAFPATVKPRTPKPGKKPGKPGKGETVARAAAPSADAICGWLADAANRAAFVKFARLHADAKKLVASIAAEVAKR